MTTAEAAELLGVRSDSVHGMKADGRLKVVGKGKNGVNLFLRRDVESLKVQRLKGRRVVPEQGNFWSSTLATCDDCPLRTKVADLERRLAAAEQKAAVSDDKARRAMVAMNAAVIGE
ncbi:hypothetical protein [Streptomyces tremellae]